MAEESFKVGNPGASSSGEAVPAFKVGSEKLIAATEMAAEKLRGILSQSGKTNGALRLAVVGGGCSGLQYQMEIVEGPKPKDILVNTRGVNIVVDSKSALYVSGSQLDFSEDLQKGGFKVTNPNAASSCSCGESFSV